MPDWVCPHCIADVDDGFDVCWQCGSTADGKHDDDFVREIDVATLPPNHVRTIQCDDCGYRGKMMIARYRPRTWVYLVTPPLLLSFFGMIPLFLSLRFAESLRFKVCPKCRGGAIHDWHGSISAENEQLWIAASDDEDRQFRQSRFQMHCLILETLLVPARIMLAVWIANR